MGKNSVVYEIRFEHHLECHFATNKMRQIQRIETYKNKVPQMNQDEDDEDLEDEFDALSNNLDAFGQDINAENIDSENMSYDEDEKAEQTPHDELVPNSYGDQYKDYMKKFDKLSRTIFFECVQFVISFQPFFFYCFGCLY